MIQFVFKIRVVLTANLPHQALAQGRGHSWVKPQIFIKILIMIARIK